MSAPAPSPFALTPEQIALQRRARAFAAETVAPQAAATDRSEAYPWPVVEAMAKAGFFGMTIPEAWGGRGASFLDATLVIEEMAKVCGVTGRIAVEANMGAISAVMQYGTDAQKRACAERVLAGDKPAICITEPEAGSAATEMTTRADRRAGGYVLNGAKHWITGGGVSDTHLIFARVFGEDGAEQGIGGFLAFRYEAPDGLEIGAREPTMGLRGIPETEVFFRDLFIPDDRVLLPPSGFRRGFADLMDAYNAQRCGAATVALGLAQGAYDLAAAWLSEREQFGRPLAEFQGLQWMAADMTVALEAARLLIRRAAASADPFPDPMLAAQAKLFASESAIRVANDALQMFGARGYSRNRPLERIVRDARMFTIGGGTAQVLRTVIAGKALGIKTPQTRDGYAKLAARKAATRDAAE
jgi:alkylation response protein AidB-like acyl-CoA dehydrogenase